MKPLRGHLARAFLLVSGFIFTTACAGTSPLPDVPPFPPRRADDAPPYLTTHPNIEIHHANYANAVDICNAQQLRNDPRHPKNPIEVSFTSLDNPPFPIERDQNFTDWRLVGTDAPDEPLTTGDRLVHEINGASWEIATWMHAVCPQMKGTWIQNLKDKCHALNAYAQAFFDYNSRNPFDPRPLAGRIYPKQNHPLTDALAHRPARKNICPQVE